MLQTLDTGSSGCFGSFFKVVALSACKGESFRFSSRASRLLRADQ